MFNLFGPTVPQITVEEVKKYLDEKKDVLLLDVRTTGEFSRSHIEGSINVPLDEVVHRIATVSAQKDKRMYVYCLSGSRSVHAVDALIKLGYTNVYNMTSGLLAWRVKKYPEVV